MINCVHPIILRLSITPDNWDAAETCSEVAHREEDGSESPVRTHLSKLLSAETFGPAEGLR